MYILYKTIFVLLLCIYTYIFPMHFSWLFPKQKKSEPKVEYSKSSYPKDKSIIVQKNMSKFEIICRKKINHIIAQEVEREKIFDKKFVPSKPLEVLKKLTLPRSITKLLEAYGKELEWEFNVYYRNYKNVRGAWNLFIASIVAMEDMYE